MVKGHWSKTYGRDTHATHHYHRHGNNKMTTANSLRKLINIVHSLIVVHSLSLYSSGPLVVVAHHSNRQGTCLMVYWYGILDVHIMYVVDVYRYTAHIQTPTKTPLAYTAHCLFLQYSQSRLSELCPHLKFCWHITWMTAKKM